MDPSSPAAQDVQNQTPTTKPATDPASVQKGTQNVKPNSDPQVQAASTQPASASQPKSVPTPSKTQISVSGSGGLEAGSAVVVQEDSDDDDEEELQVAPQEKKNLGVMGQGEDDEQGDETPVISQAPVVDVSEETPRVQAAVPEVVVSSPEVEKLVEITPPEQPKIAEEIKRIGVTHSGPGIIDAAQAAVASEKIPISFEQVLNEEEKIKSNRLHNSKFWLLEKIKYLWMKVNPNIELTVKKQETKKIASVKTLPVKTNQTTQLKTKNEELKAA